MPLWRITSCPTFSRRGVIPPTAATGGCGTSCPTNLHPASYYLQQAAFWANAYITGPNDAADTLNLYDVSGLAHFELYRALALAGNPNGTGLVTNQTALLADLQKRSRAAISEVNSKGDRTSAMLQDQVLASSYSEPSFKLVPAKSTILTTDGHSLRRSCG
jgi:hypothetical protein